MIHFKNYHVLIASDRCKNVFKDPPFLAYPYHYAHHTLNDVELIPLLKVRNSRDSYRYTIGTTFYFYCRNLKKWYKSDQWSLIIILPLYIVQPLLCICSYSPCFILQSYWSITFVVLFSNSCTNIFPMTHRILVGNGFTRSNYWHIEH